MKSQNFSNQEVIDLVDVLPAIKKQQNFSSSVNFEGSEKGYINVIRYSPEANKQVVAEKIPLSQVLGQLYKK
jgi:hypothetical protein